MKVALSKVTLKQDNYKILTTLPLDWSVRKIQNIFTADLQSHLMAGRKEFVKIPENGEMKSVEKRLLFFDIKEIHNKFIWNHPEIKISLCTFTKLRPLFCISVESKGTHNVCVCHIHQNMRLNLIGLNDIFQKKGMEKKYEVRNILKLMVCENSTSACFLLDCDQCFGVGPIVNELSDLSDSNGIEEITLKSWTKTDR